MPKPSKAQLCVLSKMRDGWMLHWGGGLNPWATLCGGAKHGYSGQSVRTSTVMVLLDTGLINISPKDFSWHGKATLTTAGREVADAS